MFLFRWHYYCVAALFYALVNDTDELIYSLADVTETVVNSSVFQWWLARRFNQAQPSGVLYKSKQKSKQSDTPTFGVAEDRCIFY